jgi:hypothetical protein
METPLESHEEWLVLLAEFHPSDAVSTSAMNLLQRLYDPTYVWCEELDYAVVKNKECNCINEDKPLTKQNDDYGF